jgi:hypothetical protein
MRGVRQGVVGAQLDEREGGREPVEVPPERSGAAAHEPKLEEPAGGEAHQGVADGVPQTRAGRIRDDEPRREAFVEGALQEGLRRLGPCAEASRALRVRFAGHHRVRADGEQRRRDARACVEVEGETARRVGAKVVVSELRDEGVRLQEAERPDLDTAPRELDVDRRPTPQERRLGAAHRVAGGALDRPGDARHAVEGVRELVRAGPRARRDERDEDVAAAVRLEPDVPQIPRILTLVPRLDAQARRGIGDGNGGRGDVGMIDQAARHVGELMAVTTEAPEVHPAAVRSRDALARPTVPERRRTTANLVDDEPVVIAQHAALLLALPLDVEDHPGTPRATPALPLVLGARRRDAFGSRRQPLDDAAVRTPRARRPRSTDVLQLHEGALARKRAKHMDLGLRGNREPLTLAPERVDVDGNALTRFHGGTIPLTTRVVAVVLSPMSRLDAPWPVATTALGGCHAGTVLWRFGGQRMVTVVAKASFALTADADMTLVAPEPLHRSERQEGGPMSSVRRASEVVPQLRFVDVTMTGHAHPPYLGATETAVRLAIQTDTSVLLDRLVYAVGDPDPATGGRHPMRPVPLGYERAYGGIGCADNPLGVGFGANAHEAPNLVDPRGADQVAALTPIPAVFPSRKHRLGPLPRSALGEPVIVLPDDFDWDYFQSAPAAQRIPMLQGGEWLTLEGVFPGIPRLQTRLPELTVVARAYVPVGHATQAPELMPLRLDMVHVDADEGTCHVVWRGSFALAEEEAVDALTLAVALGPASLPIAWPDASTVFGQAPPRSVSAYADEVPTFVPSARFEPELGTDATIAADAALAPLPPTFEGTVALAPGGLGRSISDAAPFAIAAPKGGSTGPAIPGAPWAPPSDDGPRAAAMRGAGEETVALTNADARREALEQAQREAEERRLADEARRREELERERMAAEERRLAEEAAERARKEAEERRLAEAEKFRREQEEAQREAERRAAQKAAERREQTDQVKRNLYGAFKRKH